MAERTTIEVTKATRTMLRVWKAQRGLTYDEAIVALIENADGPGELMELTEPGERPQDRRVADVDDLEIPGQGELREARLEAVRAAVAFLEAEGTATKQQILDRVVDEPGDLGYQDPRSVWKNLLQPTLSSLNGVESEGPSGRWRSTG